MEELKVFLTDMKIILKNDFFGVAGTLVLFTLFSANFVAITTILMPVLLLTMLLLLKHSFNFTDKTDKLVIKIFIKTQLVWITCIILTLILTYVVSVFVTKQVTPDITEHTVLGNIGYLICSVLYTIGFMLIILVDYTIRFFTQGSKIGEEYYYKFSNLPKVLFWSIQMLFICVAYYSMAYHKHLHDWLLPTQAFLNIYFTYKYILGNDLQPKKKTAKVESVKDEHELQFV